MGTSEDASLVYSWRSISHVQQSFIMSGKIQAGLGKRRTGIEITADILVAADVGATKSKILHITGLSTNTLAQHLYEMFTTGLLDYEPEQRKYSSSPKGRDFLQVYEHMKTITNVIQVIKRQSI